MQKYQSWDPMGEALRAWMDGRRDAKIIVNNSVQEDEELEASWLFRDPAEAVGVERVLLQHCKGKVLDIGAGAGIHSMYLQKRGMDVTAIDVSSESVAIMKEIGVRNAFCADVFDWDQGPYDTLLMMMNGIGIVGDLEGLKRFFEKAKSLLAPGGAVLLESTDILYAYENEDESLTIPGNHYYGEIEYQMSFDGKAGAAFPWLFVDPATLSLMADKAGWACNVMFEGETYNYAARMKLA
ncbi:MAG: class I SAM-dependent methyltransferase [Bacteroidia bacterium]